MQEAVNVQRGRLFISCNYSLLNTPNSVRRFCVVRYLVNSFLVTGPGAGNLNVSGRSYARAELNANT